MIAGLARANQNWLTFPALAHPLFGLPEQARGGDARDALRFARDVRIENLSRLDCLRDGEIRKRSQPRGL
jgi:hypothetical protein